MNCLFAVWEFRESFDVCCSSLNERGSHDFVTKSVKAANVVERSYVCDVRTIDMYLFHFAATVGSIVFCVFFTSLSSLTLLATANPLSDKSPKPSGSLRSRY